VRANPAATERKSVYLQFDDNALLPLLYGEHDRYLTRIEQQLEVQLSSRGNRLEIAGAADDVDTAHAALLSLWRQLERRQPVGPAEVDAALRMAEGRREARAGVAAAAPDAEAAPAMLRREAQGAPPAAAEAEMPVIRTRKALIAPRSPVQADYLRALAANELVFGLGPAGTGKTYLAVAQAVSMLLGGQVDRIVLSRPAVEAGERLGFLPGDLREKIDPYLRPLYDALYDMLPGEQVVRRLSAGEIEIAPLAFMRGRTLANAYVILDEAQNTTTTQMKMFLTRLGENSRMAVTGDLSQIDLPPGQRSGLRDAVETLAQVKGVAMVHFSNRDVVRHPLVTRIVEAYDAQEARNRTTARGGARARASEGGDAGTK